MFALIKKSKLLNLIDIDTQIHLFNTMIVPVLTYGCEIWGYSNINQLERLQLRFHFFGNF